MVVFKASVILLGLMAGVGVLLGFLEWVIPEPSMRNADVSRVAVVGQLPDPDHPRPPGFVP
jgi:hypothetical protein